MKIIKTFYFESPKRSIWISHLCNWKIKKANHKNGAKECVQIILDKSIHKDNFEPYHIVLLSCWIEFIKKKGYNNYLTTQNKELDTFIREDIDIRKYWTTINTDHIDSPDPSRLNLWRIVKGRDEEYRISVDKYFSNKFPDKDFFMLNNCLCELYFNIFDHSESDGIAFSYIHYDDSKETIRIAICDFGKGIANTIRNAYPNIQNDEDALVKSLEKGISAKTQKHNAGFGLDNVLSCLGEGSQLKIISNGAFLISLKKEDQIETKTYKLSFYFKGTLIYFDLNISGFENTEINKEFTF